jgi:hypothetical protein
MIAFGFTSSFSSNVSAYKQPQYLNLIYYGINRPILISGAMILLFIILLGNLRLAAHILKNPYCRALGRVSFVAGLAGPIVIAQLFYS